ncbi:MAG: hypothetical protein FRX49_03432 [Trebouxia sp. A1-2]|nr:MAG: hypothetical protein FRX49_03432 [Trebouxia sp. A1-2]
MPLIYSINLFIFFNVIFTVLAAFSTNFIFLLILNVTKCNRSVYTCASSAAYLIRHAWVDKTAIVIPLEALHKGVGEGNDASLIQQVCYLLATEGGVTQQPLHQGLQGLVVQGEKEKLHPAKLKQALADLSQAQESLMKKSSNRLLYDAQSYGIADSSKV